MSKIHRVIAAFLSLVMLVTWPSLAYGQTISETQEQLEGDYSVVKKGEKVPFDGYLFDVAGMVNLMVNKSLELEKLKINYSVEIAKLKIELDLLNKQHNIELKIKEDLNINLMKIKDDRIKLLEDSSKWDYVKTIGALILGIVLSVVIFYAAVQITNNINITSK